MKKYTLCLIIFFSQNAFCSNFEPFQKILSANIRSKSLPGGGFESSFDYQKAFDDKATFDLINNQKEILKKFATKKLKTKNEANAFWINAYNFFMISVILEQGFKDKKLSIDSVKDLGSFFSPYKIFQTSEHQIGKNKMSLDEIEKKTLLGEDYKKKGWKDARIHFAVNCASVGCPPLREMIYIEKNIDKLLNENIQKALKTNRHFNIKDKTLNLTHLFKWYKKDFEEDSGSVINFLKKHIEDKTTLENLSSTKDINYIEYNWKLNKPENF